MSLLEWVTILGKGSLWSQVAQPLMRLIVVVSHPCMRKVATTTSSLVVTSESKPTIVKRLEPQMQKFQKSGWQS